MRTDIQIHQIFQSTPELLLDLLGRRDIIADKYQSISFKEVERRVDGVLFPKKKTMPLLVVEFQFWASKDIFWRTIEELVATERQHPGRLVEGIIIFGSADEDKYPSHWQSKLQVRYMDEELRLLAEKYPDHPLPKVFAPVFEKNQAKLEKDAAKLYRDIKLTKLGSGESRGVLCKVFESFLMGRLKNLNAEQINKMLQLPNITETRAGREIMAMGKSLGIKEGQVETLLRLASKKFGMLPNSSVSAISRLTPAALLQLEDYILTQHTASEFHAFVKTLLGKTADKRSGK